jgi:hypothetical protein
MFITVQGAGKIKRKKRLSTKMIIAGLLSG